MKLSMKAPASFARAMVKTLNIFTQLYAKTYNLQISMHKTGMRLRGSEGYFDVIPQLAAGSLDVNLIFPSDQGSIHNKTYGTAVVLLYAFRSLLRFTSDKITIVHERTDLHNISSAEKWAVWAVKKVAESYPDQAKAVVPADYLTDPNNAAFLPQKKIDGKSAKKPLPKRPKRAVGL